MINNNPIGLFDSGIGGTSIWNAIHQLMPNENTIYLADSKNAPYGVKSKEEIIALSKKNTELMLEWKKIILEILGKNNTISWTTLGSSILNNLYSTKNTLYSNYKIFNGLDNLYPIFWKNCVNEFIKKPYDNYKNLNYCTK